MLEEVSALQDVIHAFLSDHVRGLEATVNLQHNRMEETIAIALDDQNVQTDRLQIVQKLSFNPDPIQVLLMLCVLPRLGA